MLCAKKICTYFFALTHTGKVKKYTFYISAIWHLFFKSCCSFLFYNKNKSMRLLCRIYHLMASGALKRTRFHRFINNIPVASEHFWTPVGYSKNGWPIILDWNLRFWMVLKGFVDIKFTVLHPVFVKTIKNFTPNLSSYSVKKCKQRNKIYMCDVTVNSCDIHL